MTEKEKSRKNLKKFSSVSLRVNIIKPEGQVELSEDDLLEEHSVILQTKLTQEFELIEYSWKKGQWIPCHFDPNYIKLVQVRVVPLLTTRGCKKQITWVTTLDYMSNFFIPCYKITPWITTFLINEGVLLHRDSPEAQIQLQYGYIKGSEMSIAHTISETEEFEGKVEGVEEEEEGEGAEEEVIEEEQEKEVEEEQEEEIEPEMEEEAGEEGELIIEGIIEEQEIGGEDESEVDEYIPIKFVKLPNAFNFVEDESLTYEIISRDFTMQTEKECRLNFSEGFSPMTMWDTYAADYAIEEKKKLEAEMERRIFLKVKGKKKRKKMERLINQKRELFAAEILERMIFNNIYTDIYWDYQYWNDPSDEFKEFEGTLLPLFTFQYEPFKNHAVTFIDTCDVYKELFAVGFGCFEHARQEICPGGGFCLFTVGNPEHPLWAIHTDVGVMAVSIHKTYTNLIACGLSDGGVQVYDYDRYFEKRPSAESLDKHMHLGIVTQVVWAKDDPYRNINLFSCGTDGCVINWFITEHGLEKALVLSQQLERISIGLFGVKVPLMCSFTCIVFHPERTNEYYLGDEFGSIYHCHIDYMYTCKKEYKAHSLLVTRIDFNKFIPAIFASCSNDFMVKIWEEGRDKSLYDLDLDAPVGDVQWAPYSSTVLAACTDFGHIHVFDININQTNGICVQPIVPKRKYMKLTRLEFNTELPILRCGDDRGTVHLLRISPNLRKKLKPSRKEPDITDFELEVRKLNELLYFEREPDVLDVPDKIYWVPKVMK